MKKIGLILLSGIMTVSLISGCAPREIHTPPTEAGIMEAPMAEEAAPAEAPMAEEAAPAEAPMAEEEFFVQDDEYGLPQYDDVYRYNRPSFSNEEYNEITENGFKSVYTNPLSTFSADVDTASYSNVRRMIEDGFLPEKDAVKTEEIINYFSYDYEEPSGKAPFSITTEIAPSPFNENAKLLSVLIGTQNIPQENLPPSNLVFLIDTSGSMNDVNKLPLVKESFALLTENLGEDDRVSIVTYAGDDRVLLMGAGYNDRQEITDAINNLESGGATHGSKGLLTAYEIAQEYYIEGGNNRIILATDGDLNVGLTTDEELTRLVEEKRETGIYLSALGFGDGNYKDNKMEALSQNGNGNYYYIDTKFEAQKVLVEEMGSTLNTVADDVKIQVEFNPEMVEGYRLIGYENRLLDDKDFADDTKDAGEVGAGHSVCALYEIIPAYSDNSSIEYKYAQNESNEEKPSNDEWLTVSVRFKSPGEENSNLMAHPVAYEDSKDTMSDNLKLMTSAAEFAMLLRDSEFAGSANYEEILDRLKTLDNFTEDDYIIEFYNIVKKASAL